MRDLKEARKVKKRKRLIKKYILLTIVILVLSFIFFIKAPIFNIKQIVFQGNSTIKSEALAPIVSSNIGQNIFTINEKYIENRLEENKYIKSVSVKRKGLNTLKIVISEESPVYYINNNEVINIINNNFEVIESVPNINDRKLVEIKGIDLSTINNGEMKEQKNLYVNVLKEFFPFISENREEIYLNSLDISNIVDIRGYVGEVEIYFGDTENLYNKMENVYRILLDEKINLTNGYINVSFNGTPVIKREEEVREEN